MVSSEDFVEQFITDCAENGCISPSEICAQALNKIDELKKQLIDQNAIRTEIRNLTSVLRTFNHESIQRLRKTNTYVNPDIFDNDVLDESYHEIALTIYEYLDSVNEPVTSRDILEVFGDVEHSAAIYSVIKWLCTKGILNKNEETREIIKGENWNNRQFSIEKLSA